MHEPSLPANPIASDIANQIILFRCVVSSNETKADAIISYMPSKMKELS